jgi:hypothetical protein
MIEVHVEPHEGGALKGKYDIRVRDGGNHELLVFSSQGCENIAYVEAWARRLFARGGNAEAVKRIRELLDGVTDATQGLKSEIETIFAGIEAPEPVDLIVRKHHGKGRTEMIR